MTAFGYAGACAGFVWATVGDAQMAASAMIEADSEKREAAYEKRIYKVPLQRNVWKSEDLVLKKTPEVQQDLSPFVESERRVALMQHSSSVGSPTQYPDQ